MVVLHTDIDKVPITIVGRFEGLLRGTFSEERSPLMNNYLVLTESWDFDTMHRRAGGVLAPGGKHADAHSWCPIGSCGARPGSYRGGSARETYQTRSQKIVTWRKAKAARNRAYLEEKVYGIKNRS